MSTDTSSPKPSIFFTEATEKLHQRFPIEDFNFFDSSTDFTIEVGNVMLLDQLARGAYGVVYNGIMNREKYAVKIEDLRTGVEEQVNILSELTVLQSLPHERLVKYYGTGYLSKSAAEAKVMIVMELCEHGALRERINEDLPWPLAVRLALDVARGLAFLHENNVIHRDIKTTNVLVDKDWRAKICDFSFSCHRNSTTKREFIYGTDEFMSPEVAMGEEFDISSDIFSFGILLCEIITQREPNGDFLKRYAHKGCFALPEEELREAVLADCPESLEALAIQCCDIEPAERPSAADCVEWLEALLEDLGGTSSVGNMVGTLPVKTAVAGVSPIREGTVVYPKTKDMDVARFSSRPPSGTKKKQSTPPREMDVYSRIAYLEVQVQELRAENRCLTREVSKLSMISGDPTRGVRSESDTRFSRMGTTTSFRSSAPASPASPRSESPATIKKTPVGAGRPSSSYDSMRDEIDSLSRTVKDLASELFSLRARQRLENAEKGPTSSTKIPEQNLHANCGQSPTVARDNTYISGTSPSCHSPSILVRMGNGDHHKPPRREVPQSYGASPYDVPFTENGSMSGSDDDASESRDKNLDSVVQSFLDVVGKCSQIKEKAQNTIDSIDQKAGGVVSRQTDTKPSRAAPPAHTRASPSSPYHYSPHPGFLSQLTESPRRGARSASPVQSIHSRSSSRLAGNSSAVSSPQSGGVSMSNRPSLLSQANVMRREQLDPSDGIDRTARGPHSAQPPLSESYPDEDFVDLSNPNRMNVEDMNESEYSHEGFDVSDTRTPPAAHETWRTVHSRTPPPPDRARYDRAGQDLRGRLTQEDINAAADMPSGGSGLARKSPVYRSRDIGNRRGSNDSVSRLSNSPQLRGGYISHEQQMRTSASKFFHADYVRESVFRNDAKHGANSTPRTSVGENMTTRISESSTRGARSLGSVVGR